MHPPASPADRPFNPVAVVMLAALAVVLIFGGQVAWDAWRPDESAQGVVRWWPYIAIAGLAPRNAMTSIHTAMAIIIRFSVRDRKPKGTLLSPPTQAHFSSRLSI